MSSSPIAALEIGTCRTVVLVGEMDEDQHLTVLGKGVAPSFGIRKGQVTDTQHARNGVAIALKQAADQGQTDIWSVLLAVAAGHVKSRVNVATVPVASRDHIVSAEDVEDVIEGAKFFTAEPDREVMHTIPQTYALDGLRHIYKPEGLQGRQLQLSMLIIDGKRAGIANLRNIAIDSRVDVSDIVFSGLCDALAVLTPEQKRNGVVVIDLGGGTTDYLVYADTVIASAGSIAVGGEHVTSDLSSAFNIDHKQAESLKLQYASAVVPPKIGLKRIQLPTGLGRDGQSVSMSSFQTVVNARMDETLRLIRTHLAESQLLHKLGAGVVFTGGGAAMPGLLELGASIFGLPCMVGDPRVNVSGLDDVPDPAAYSTAVGLLAYGAKSQRETGVMESIRNRLGRIFG